MEDRKVYGPGNESAVELVRRMSAAGASPSDTLSALACGRVPLKCWSDDPRNGPTILSVGQIGEGEVTIYDVDGRCIVLALDEARFVGYALVRDVEKSSLWAECVLARQRMTAETREHGVITELSPGGGFSRPEQP